MGEPSFTITPTIFFKEDGKLVPVKKAVPKPAAPKPVDLKKQAAELERRMTELQRLNAKIAADLDRIDKATVTPPNLDGPHKPSATGRANTKRHAAVEEVERLAVKLQDSHNGKSFSYMSREQALVAALRLVSREVQIEYFAYRADVGYEAGPKPPPAGEVRKVDLAKALAAYREAIAAGEPTTKVAQEIRKARAFLGWSQQRLADESNCSRVTINAVENGRYGVSGLTLSAICRSLGLDVRELGR